MKHKMFRVSMDTCRKAALCLLATCSGATYAQQKSLTDSIFKMHEIEVCADKYVVPKINKLPVPLQFMPITVNSISGELLENRNIVDLNEAVKFLPSTRLRTTYGGFTQFSVRGFDHTPIMIDGVRDERTSINNSAPLPDLSSCETVELIKGPASVLYGHSVVGGVLNVVRKSPVAQPLVKARMSYGTWNNKQSSIDLGGKVYGNMNYRATLNYSDNEGYRQTNNKRFSGYLALGGKINEHHFLELRGGFNRDKYGTEIGLPATMKSDIYDANDNEIYLNKDESLPGLNPKWRYNNESDFLKNKAENLQLTYTYTHSDAFKLDNRFSYNHDIIDYFSTESIPYLESDNPIYKHYYLKDNKGTKKYICLDTVQITYPLRFAYDVHSYNEQLEASGSIQLNNGMKYNYLAGYNFVAFFRENYRGYGGGKPLTDFIEGPGLFSKIPVNNPQSMGYMKPHFGFAGVAESYTHGLYIQNLFEFSDKLKMMVAGRFDYFAYKYASADVKDSEKMGYTNRQSYDKMHTTAFTYRAGLVYLPTEKLSFYASYANLYLPYRDFPNTDATIYINEDGERFYPTGSKTFKPQSGFQAEVGGRFKWNQYLEASASLFYIRKNNEKKTLARRFEDPEDDNILKTVVGIVGSTASQGLELELKSNPLPGLFFNAGYAFTDAKIRKMKKTALLPLNDTEKGSLLPNAPRNTFVLAGDYTVQKGMLRNLGVNITVSYMDKVAHDLVRTVEFDRYWLTDLGLGYRLDNGIGLALNVRNVFNKSYHTQSLGRQLVPSDPRNIMATVSYTL
ncbi:TonB-dependent receptor [Bacteroides coprosuis]|uniref:TonB-dependent receptor n=1 Tax=Bacteroides coprosuis TaxID=151276 RepID=UPI001D3FC88B|nr:TonB-dependent receptor [Bacteroides coprosuis]HJD91979.1 TonB-dependent receptor [Bacteroides coprosuis]